MTEDVKGLMEETPGGENHGYSVVSYNDDHAGPQVTRRDLAGRLVRMDQGGGYTRDEMPFGVVSGKDEGGLVAHRGVLAPGEYVDGFVLRDAVQADLGFTYGDVASAYALGRPTTEQRQLREKIDSRLLALSRAGGNMEQLAKALGLSEKTVDRALRRAREIDVRPMVKTGVVKTTHVCVKCGVAGATLRKRRFSDSPTEWTGNIALCDEDYARSFDRHPGNPAYWAFRDDRTPLPWPTRPAKRAQRFPADYPAGSPTRTSWPERGRNDTVPGRAAGRACKACASATARRGPLRLGLPTNGDLRGEHAKRCVRPAGVLCSRVYDPGMRPEDERLYEHSALGTLWGLNDIAAWQLAGWDIKRRAA